jgi:phospholipase/carboxylesterase
MSLITDWPHLFRAGEPGSAVLLMLHGTGGDEHDISTLAGHLDPNAGVLAPRGRVSEQGANRWFRRLAEGVFDVDDVEARADELAGFVSAAVEELDLQGRPIVAVGFSNGANIALATAMRHPEVLSRVIALSGMYPWGDRESSVRLDASRILLLNGEGDPMAPRASVERLAAALKALGADVTRVERPGGHGIAQSDVAAARDWLTA